jgi:hypothetical protein
LASILAEFRLFELLNEAFGELRIRRITTPAGLMVPVHRSGSLSDEINMAV